jgi:hypothetical protein
MISCWFTRWIALNYSTIEVYESQSWLFASFRDLGIDARLTPVTLLLSSGGNNCGFYMHRMLAYMVYYQRQKNQKISLTSYLVRFT